EILLKLQAVREKRPMLEVIREALRIHVSKQKPGLPPGGGEFESDRSDTAEKAEEILSETRFGRD
ncbi:MAG: DNA-binding protein, partial [Acidobacteriota bacterium]